MLLAEECPEWQSVEALAADPADVIPRLPFLFLNIQVVMFPGCLTAIKEHIPPSPDAMTVLPLEPVSAWTEPEPNCSTLSVLHGPLLLGRCSVATQF